MMRRDEYWMGDGVRGEGGEWRISKRRRIIIGGNDEEGMMSQEGLTKR